MKGCSLEKSKMKPFGREAIIVLGPQQEYFCDLIGTILKYKEISIDFSNGSELLLKSGYGQYTLKVKLVLPFDYYYESGKRVKDEGLWRGTLISNKISIEINPY
ncbi:hypothetical protein EPO66_05380 [bacterium]|nr:MAG: hypothetical protein EPO66_05380 [bacterium]